MFVPVAEVFSLFGPGAGVGSVVVGGEGWDALTYGSAEGLEFGRFETGPGNIGKFSRNGFWGIG